MIIDENGFCIGDSQIEDNQEIPEDCIATEVQEGLHLPKWNFTELKWIEGKVTDLVVELQNAKDGKIIELNFLCNQMILGGFSSNCCNVEGYQYKFDMEYQGNFAQQGVMLSLDPTIEVVMWPTNIGVIPHTREEFIRLCKDAQDWKSNNIYRYFGLKIQVETCTEIEQINNIVLLLTIIDFK